MLNLNLHHKLEFLGVAAVVTFAFEQGELSCHSVVAADCRVLLSDFGLAGSETLVGLQWVESFD